MNTISFYFSFIRKNMWEKAKNFWNRLWNTAMIAPRLAWTAVNTVSDTANTLIALPKDALDVIQSTTNDIKNVFMDSWTKWRWYQRVWNVILSPVVATGTAIEWAVRTAVTPVVNGVVNGRNTVKNTVKNTRRSTFGRLFSKKPISDFSYDQLKTANIINKNKNRFSKLQFWKKKWSNYEVSENKVNKPAAVAWVATATAVAASAAWAWEVAKLKENINNLNNQIATLQEQLKNALDSKKPDVKETKWTKDLTEKKSVDEKKEKDTADWDKSSIKKEKNEDTIKWKDAKEEMKWKKDKEEVVDKKKEKWDKDVKVGEKWEGDNVEVKEKWDKEKIVKDDEYKGETDDKKWKESLDIEAKRKWLERANSLLKDSPCGKKILEGLCRKYENFWIIFDNTTSEWHHNKDSITVWTKMPKDGNNAALAPFNRDIKDKEYQTRHVLLHELAHCTVNWHADQIPEIKKWLDIIKKYIDKNSEWKTLSALTYKNDIYKSNEAKAKEDLVEMFALRMNWNGESCKKYMKLLSSDEDKELRWKYGLVNISKDDAEKLQQVCDTMAKIYEE